MKAVQYSAYGGPEVMSLVSDRPKPEIKPGFVLIKTRAAALNPIDFKRRNGMLKAISKENFPAGIGFDVSGDVESVGDGVDQFAAGDAVLARVGNSGTRTVAEYVLVDAKEVCRKPESFSYEQAAALPLAGLTALQSLRAGNIKEGDNVLVLGGAGGVGHLGIQIAKKVFKASSVTTTASPGEKTEFCQSQGADKVVNYREEKFEDVCDADSFDVGFDTTGEAEKFGRVMKPGTKVVSVAGAVTSDSLIKAGMDPNFIVKTFLWFKSRGTISALEKHKVGYEYLLMSPNGADIQTLIDAAVVAEIDSVHTLDNWADAFKRLESGRSKGKVVITIGGDE